MEFMQIDSTVQLAPLVWVILGMLIFFTGAIVASIDPELTEAYLGDPRLLIATTLVMAAVLCGVAIVMGGPEHALAALRSIG